MVFIMIITIFIVSSSTGSAATVFIIVGVVLAGIVIFAYCGVCCKSRWMLIIVSLIKQTYKPVKFSSFASSLNKRRDNVYI